MISIPQHTPLQWVSYQIRKGTGCACAGNVENIYLIEIIAIYRWLSARLQNLQCASNGNAAVLHLTIDMFVSLSDIAGIYALLCVHFTDPIAIFLRTYRTYWMRPRSLWLGSPWACDPMFELYPRVALSANHCLSLTRNRYGPPSHPQNKDEL